MASQTEMERLVGKAMFEPDFARQIFDDPNYAASSIGIKLDDQQLEAIKQLDPEMMLAIALLFSRQARWEPLAGELEVRFWLAMQTLDPRKLSGLSL